MTSASQLTRVGDETVGEMWSLFDGQDVLNDVDPQFSENIRRHVNKVLYEDPFHVSANTDPKGDCSKPPQRRLANGLRVYFRSRLESSLRA